MFPQLTETRIVLNLLSIKSVTAQRAEDSVCSGLSRNPSGLHKYTVLRCYQQNQTTFNIEILKQHVLVYPWFKSAGEKEFFVRGRGVVKKL